MKVQKKESVGGEFAKKGEDIKEGDVVKLKGEGQWIDGQFGQQFVMPIETPAGEVKNVNFNQTTINILHDEFGEDTLDWIDREVIIRVKRDVVAGKKVDIYYFVTSEWDFDEYRELVKVIGGSDEPLNEDDATDVPL